MLTQVQTRRHITLAAAIALALHAPTTLAQAKPANREPDEISIPATKADA